MTEEPETWPFPTFDLEVARGNLVRWLFEEGLATGKRVEELKSDARARPDSYEGKRNRPALSEREVDWAILWDLGNEHACRHGMPLNADPPMVAGADGKLLPCCTEAPCKALGVSLALWELHHYMAERKEPAGALVADLAELARAIGAFQEAQSDRLSRLLEISSPESNGIDLSNTGGDSLLDNVLPRVNHLATTLQAAHAQASQLVSITLEQFTSVVQEGPPMGRGRPPDRLLTACWQHLFHGGFSDAEILELVPDNQPNSEVKRVRKRVRSKDYRSFKVFA